MIYSKSEYCNLSNLYKKPANITLPLDLFGSSFFMLSRYEELIKNKRDMHGRFPASASLAFQEGFLSRPIVDEYAEILWHLIKRLWPGAVRKRREGNVRITCDVDTPFDPRAKSLLCTGVGMVLDIVKRFNIRLAFSRFCNYRARKRGRINLDPFFTFHKYMDLCEGAGRKISFFFLADDSGGPSEGNYDIFDPNIIALIKHIFERGHEIGLHATYNSYMSSERIRHERKKLESACRMSGVIYPIKSNRQHYLRWDTATTPDVLEDAKIEYDLSGAFADIAGFKYGTSRPFNMWSWQKRKMLRLRQCPLIIMEHSVISKRYMGLGYTEKALQYMLSLKENALKFGGDFTLLWHNSYLTTSKDWFFFTSLIK